MFLVLNTLDISEVPEVSKILGNDINLINVKPNKKEIFKYLKKADVYFASASYVIDKEFIDFAKNLKLVASPSTGVDHINTDYLKKKNIILYEISKEYGLLKKFTATSELTFGLILALIRNIIPANASTKKGFWKREFYRGTQLNGKTLGILGLGRLGKISAKIAEGFGMKIIACDPAIKKYRNVKIVTFQELIMRSDIITIHVHLNDDTINLIDLKEFKLMKKNSILINTSRGKIVNEKSLLYSLKNKMIAAAGVDVIDGEWLNENDRINHPLIQYSQKHSNLLIVPHIGGSTVESIKFSRIFMAKKIRKFLENLMIKSTKHNVKNV